MVRVVVKSINKKNTGPDEKKCAVKAYKKQKWG